jgi:hypothetical protein
MHAIQIHRTLTRQRELNRPTIKEMVDAESVESKDLMQQMVQKYRKD